MFSTRKLKTRTPCACMAAALRELDKTQITRLATCAYIHEHHNLISVGASGAGKAYLANAFGIAACRNYLTVKYIRFPDILDELLIARGEGVYQKAMKQYKKVQLLILDEWLLTPSETVVQPTAGY